MKSHWWRLTGIFLCFCMITAVFCVPTLRSAEQTVQPNVADPPRYTVIIDAGHGGEDGGAVSQSNIFEKDINLAVAFSLRDLLVANGVSVVLTRSEDILLYDRTVNYQGRKKALDLAARRKIAEETENAIFVSIHMNAFPLEQYCGLQVWYSQNSPDSIILAQTIQDFAAKKIQPENDRRVKPATSAIYLLHHLQCPAVLVECGFLSNPQEAELLASEDYQNQLAFLLFLSITEGMAKISS